MEIWQIITAVYLSGTLAAMYSIWWPSYKLIRAIAPYNIVAQKPVLSFIIVFFIFLLSIKFKPKVGGVKSKFF